MNKIDPKSLIIFNDLPPVASSKDRIAIDTEFFGMDEDKMHRPTGKLAWLGCSVDGEIVYYINDRNMVQEFLDRINAGVWIFHYAKFDIFHLRRYAEVPNKNKILEN